MITYLNCRLEVEHYRSSDTVCDMLTRILANSTASEAISTALFEALGEDFETAQFNGAEVITAAASPEQALPPEALPPLR